MAGRPRNPEHLVPVAQVIQPQQMLQEEWRLQTLLPAIQDTEEAIRWLARRGLLKNEQLCHVCGNRMTVGTFNGHTDGKRWRCPGRCNVTKTIRDGSWFEKSKISLPNNILLLYCWHMDLPQVQVARELEVSTRTVVDWMNFIREVCEEDLRLHPQQVGGLDEQTGLPVIVEIDESKYFHRKYHRGQWREGHWVFGGIERVGDALWWRCLTERGPHLSPLCCNTYCRAPTSYRMAGEPMATWHRLEGASTCTM